MAKPLIQMTLDELQTEYDETYAACLHEPNQATVRWLEDRMRAIDTETNIRLVVAEMARW